MQTTFGFRFLCGTLLAVVLSFTGASADTVTFHNQSSRQVSVTIMFFKAGCDGSASNFATRGWWVLNPNERKVVYSGEHRDFVYFYAYNDLGEQYTGSTYFACVPNRAFDWCQSICDNAPGTRRVGFQERFIGSDVNHVVPLIR